MSTWHIDSVHSEIGFKVKHLMVSTVRGSFGTFTGGITSGDDSFAGGKIEFSLDVSSISTKDVQRDGHLLSPDFFDAAQFPKIDFVSTEVKKIDDKKLEIKGNLTMHGVTKEIVLDVELGGISKGMDGKRVSGFDVKGKIDRKDFGLTWNAALETGGVVVGEVVDLEAFIEAKEE